MLIVKKYLIRVTVILFLLSNISCTAAQISKVLINVDEVGAAYAILNWEAVPEMTGYEVYSTSGNAKDYTLMESTTALTYTDSTLIPMSTAYYKIRPYKETEGEKVYGNYSNTVSAETTSLGATELILFGLTSKEVILNWLPIVGATSYQVLVSKVGDKALSVVCTTELLTCKLPIIPSKTHFFRVRAIMQANDQIYIGRISPALIVISDPINNPVVRLIAYENSITGSWKIDSKVSGYEIYLSETSVFIFGKKVKEVKTNTFTLTGLTTGQRYYIWVKPYVNTNTGRKYGEFVPVSKSALTFTPIVTD